MIYYALDRLNKKIMQLLINFNYWLEMKILEWEIRD